MKEVYTKFCVFCLAMLMAVGVLNQCKTTALTAPDQAVLLVSINPPVIPVGGQAVVTVVGYKGSGAPLPDCTVIFFTADIGNIDATAETTGGTARAVFRSDDNMAGTATIGVSSGNADVSPVTNTITIVSPALSQLIITADPQILPQGGGESDILVIAYDENMTVLPDIPIILTTTAGTLESGGRALYTDSAGEVRDKLQTTADATVTAASGDITASVEVKIKTNSPPTASFVFSPESPKAGDTVYFNAAESGDDDGYIVRYEWDFGDGKTAAGERVKHRFSAPNTYRVMLVVYDNSGDKGSNWQSVTVGAIVVSVEKYNVNKSFVGVQGAVFQKSPLGLKTAEMN